MDGNAQAEPCTRKLAWFRSATCMVGLRNLHGSARRSAWLDFPKCMVQLSALHGWAFKTWFAKGLGSGPNAALEKTPRIRAIDCDEFLDLFLKYYDRLDEQYQKTIPLKRVYIPVAMKQNESDS